MTAFTRKGQLFDELLEGKTIACTNSEKEWIFDQVEKLFPPVYVRSHRGPDGLFHIAIPGDRKEVSNG